MKVYEMCDELEKIAPLMRQADWDNSGLIIGSYGDEIKKVLICLDVSEEIMSYAFDKGYNFVISHHPLIFKGVKRITDDDHTQKIILAAIKNKISIYAMHTNYDFADHAMNDYIAGMIGLDDVKGYGIEPVKNFYLGRIGTIKEGIGMKALADLVKDRLRIDKLSYTGNDEKLVYNVLIQTGALDPELFDLKKGDIDVIITGDVKYHAAWDLMAKNIYVIDAGHFGTEIIFSSVLSDQLRKTLPDVTIDRVDFEKDIFKHV